jgi:lactose/cellobiose-specific phosphotransferase system IIC component
MAIWIRRPLRNLHNARHCGNTIDNDSLPSNHPKRASSSTMNGRLFAASAHAGIRDMSIARDLIDKLRKLAAPKWAFSPTLLAVRNGFLLCLPIVAVGVLAVLINNFPLPWYQEGMTRLFGGNWKSIGKLLWQGTLGIITLPMLVGISYHLTIRRNQEHPLQPTHPMIAAMVAVAALFILIPTEGADGLAYWLGTPGLFVAIIVALTSTRLFLWLVNAERLRIRIYSEGLDSSIAQAFFCLLPGTLTLLFFALLYGFFYRLTGSSLHEFIYACILYPFSIIQNSIDTGAFYLFITHLLWFFGIHGPNVLDPLTHNMFDAALQANQVAEAAGKELPHIITKHFLDIFVSMGGSGSSLCLIIALLIGSHNNNSRRLAKISLVPGMFNINEILLFGLPIILNPIFLIPFICVPLVLMATSALALHFGFVPNPMQPLDWTTPPLLGGFFSTRGSFSGVFLQLFNLAIGTLIYLPFVKISDEVKTDRQKRAMRKLMEVACNNQTGPAGKKCLDREDEVGVLARVLAYDLRTALAKHREAAIGLFLEYQPQVDSSSGQVMGTEALVRWRHPDYGNIPAPILIAISEDGDFIDALGLWVLRAACEERARWHEAGIDANLKTSVNASVRQLMNHHLPEVIRHCLETYRLEPRMIGIEVTESVAIDPEAPHTHILKKIHDMGLIVSIDDFGAGHSSLIYLKYFPVDILKIDQALSKDVVNNKTCAEVIATIVELCHSLDIKIVVEYVENREQIEVLQDLGCYIFQGYFYSKPLVGEQALAYIQSMNAAQGKHACDA